MAANSGVGSGSYSYLPAIRSMAVAGRDFEPFPGVLFSQATLSQLVRAELAEAGPSCRPAVAPVGYRLTAEGWRMAKENWSARRGRRS